MKDIVSALLAAFFDCIASTVDASTFLISNDLKNYVTDIWVYFGIFGTGLTIMYFLIEMNNRFVFERSDFTMKSLFAPLLKLTIALIIISQGAKIMVWIISLGNNFIKVVGENFMAGEYDKLSNDLVAAYNKMTGGKMSFFLALALLLPLLTAFLAAIVCALIWEYKALVWKCEVLFRLGITPIALADIYSGKNSNAIRWIKGFLACTLTGGAYVILPKLMVIISAQSIIDRLNDSTTLGVDGTWGVICKVFLVIVIPVAALGAASMVKTALKEALS